MKDTVEIKTDEEQAERTRKKKPKRKINKYGVYISIIFIATGLIWYAINLGIIPVQLVIQQAGPIIIIILGILILIKSL